MKIPKKYTSPYCTGPILDQGGTGASVAFAMAYAYKAIQKIPHQIKDGQCTICGMKIKE